MTGRRLELALLVLAVLGTPRDARADERTVRGRVVDAITGAPLESVTVLVGNGASDGSLAVTAVDGGFVLTDAAPGPVAISVYADGYLPLTVSVAADERQRLRIALVPDGNLEVIEITGEAPELTRQTIYQLDRDQVRALPGTGNDILRAVQSLPGVARMSYGIGGLVLRGTSPGDTDVYLDDVEVPLAFHFGGVSTFYPSTLLEDVIVHPGGGDVSRGRGVGGVVELRSRAPRRDRWRAGGELGVMDASSYAEGPLAGGAVAFGVRRSYIDAILPAVMEAEDLLLPRYYDGQLRWDRAAGAGTITASLFFSDDQIRFVEQEGLFDNSFARAAVRYRRHRDGTTATVTPSLGITTLRYSSSDHDDSTMSIQHVPLGLRADLVRDTSWGHVAVGVDVQATRSRLLRVEDEGDDLPATLVEREQWHGDGALWGETRWRIDDGKLTVKPGVRLAYFSLSDRWVADPRAVVTHELADWFTLRETFGLHRQPPGAGGENAKPKRSIHASIGTDLRLPRAVRASLTAYYVELSGRNSTFPLSFSTDGGDENGLFGTADQLGSHLDVVSANILGEAFGLESGARRHSHGLELSLQRRGDRSLCWISYTLSRSQESGGWSWHPYALDQTHNLSAVASRRLGAWQLGARFRYVSGFPYVGQERWERMAAFTSLDLRVDRAWRRAWGTIAFFVDLQNATNAKNPESVVTDQDGKATVRRGLPIFPMLGVSFTPPE